MKTKFTKEDIGKTVSITTDKESLRKIGHAIDGEEIVGNEGVLVEIHPQGFCKVKITKIEHYQNPPQTFEITLKFLNEHLELKTK